jgi:hypothetical protein
MKGEDASGTRIGIPFVTKEGFDTGGLVKERKWTGMTSSEEFRKAVGVTTRLFSNGRKGSAFLFGFDHAECFAVYEQQVITGAGFERNLPNSDPTPSGEIDGLVILDNPTAIDELGVDLLASALFRARSDIARQMNVANNLRRELDVLWEGVPDHYIRSV